MRSRVQKCQSLLSLATRSIEAFSTNILLFFYRAAVESLIKYGIKSFYGNLSVQFKPQLMSITITSSRIVGCTFSLSLLEILEQTLVRQAQKICSDATHVLS